jgi:polysaccharide export outer membrane protein
MGVISFHAREFIRSLFFLLFLLAGSIISPSFSYAQGTEAYTLGAGDQIRVTVFGHEDLSGMYEVDGLGRVSLPLIQDVDANGMTLRQFETAITDKLKPDFLKNPKVSVDVLNYRPFYIIGEVKKPGSYAFVNGMTVVNAIALAGGYTYRAKEDNVLIVRADDISRTKEKGTHATTILPGDVIEVEERYF